VEGLRKARDFLGFTEKRRTKPLSAKLGVYRDDIEIPRAGGDGLKFE
jgi:hypothetical protein